MITYNTLEDGNLKQELEDGRIKTIPTSHGLYNQALEEEANGLATINPYTPPTPSPLEIRNNALANITWIRPSDSIEIQVRHPDYASDYLIISAAIAQMSTGETILWISKDDQPVLVSKEDLEAAIAFQAAEINSIYETYIATL